MIRLKRVVLIGICVCGLSSDVAYGQAKTWTTERSINQLTEQALQAQFASHLWVFLVLGTCIGYEARRERPSNPTALVITKVCFTVAVSASPPGAQLVPTMLCRLQAISYGIEQRLVHFYWELCSKIVYGRLHPAVIKLKQCFFTA